MQSSRIMADSMMSFQFSPVIILHTSMHRHLTNYTCTYSKKHFAPKDELKQNP